VTWGLGSTRWGLVVRGQGRNEADGLRVEGAGLRV